jgi:transcription initiation factor IIE alpha subunit
MNDLNQSIPCPVCQTKIPFDTKQLLLGVQFVCPNCQAAIGLAEESKPLVQQTMEKFEAVKGQFSKE